MKRAALVMLACGMLAHSGAVSGDEDGAFQIDKREFEDRVRTVALTPVDADGYFEMPAGVEDIIQGEVTRRLEKEGLKVLPSSILAGIQATMEQQVGGITDAETGEMILDRAQAVRTHSFRELWFRHDFDALVNIRVSISRVGLENDEVEWDGTRQDIPHEGRSPKYTAKVYVSSVGVGFYDATLTPLYLHHGGLEPLMYRAGEQLESRDKSELFRDEKKIREAVEIALDPL